MPSATSKKRSRARSRLVFLMKNPKMNMCSSAELVPEESVEKFFPEWKQWMPEFQIDREHSRWRRRIEFGWFKIGTSIYIVKNEWFFGVYDRDKLAHINSALYTALSEQSERSQSAICVD